MFNFQKLKKILLQFILIPLRNGEFISTIGRMPLFYRQWNEYQRKLNAKIGIENINVQLFDSTAVTQFDPHYFYQSAWCARKLSLSKPTLHIDVASQINLIAPLSAFIKVEFIDFRPLLVNINNLSSKPGNILNLEYKDKSVESLSCLHVIEHIGLGRYGDTIDVDGSKKSCKELQRILAVNGNLYLTTPIGKERIEFNAHRIHFPDTIIQYFNELELVDFSIVNDSGEYIEHANFNECNYFQYGLGLFHFRRNLK